MDGSAPSGVYGSKRLPSLICHTPQAPLAVTRRTTVNGIWAKPTKRMSVFVIKKTICRGSRGQRAFNGRKEQIDVVRIAGDKEAQFTRVQLTTTHLEGPMGRKRVGNRREEEHEKEHHNFKIGECVLPLVRQQNDITFVLNSTHAHKETSHAEEYVTPSP